jgi:thioredoxin-like negative regulator of GroEL
LRRQAATLADPLARAELLNQAADLSGGRPEIVLDLVAALLDAGLADYAAAGLDSIEPRERDEAWLKLKARLDLARGPGEVDEAALDARITADPKDFEARFALATLHAQRQAWSAASPSCWRSCCATRPTPASRRGTSWWSGSRYAPTRRR